MKAYFSCGAGDFIAIESFLDDKTKRNIKEFYLFTRSAKTISELINLHPYWRGLPVYIPMTEKDIFGHGVYAFYDIKHLRKITGHDWPELDNVIDFSGEVLYPKILRGETSYKESLFEVNSYSVDVVVDRASMADDRMVAKGRNLTDSELEVIAAKIKNKTTIYANKESMAVDTSLGFVRGCKEFYGVDSMLSVWAARQPNIQKIMVKTINPIYRKWLPIYDPLKKIEVVDEFK